MIERDVAALVLGCTEIPVALAGVALPLPVIDATAALARACVAWSRARQPVVNVADEEICTE